MDKQITMKKYQFKNRSYLAAKENGMSFGERVKLSSQNEDKCHLVIKHDPRTNYLYKVKNQ